MSARGGFNAAFGACGGVLAFLIIVPLFVVGGCIALLKTGDTAGKVKPEYIPAPTAAEAEEIMRDQRSATQ